MIAGTVYVVEACDYEQRSVYYVADSLVAAVAAITSGYDQCGSKIDASRQPELKQFGGVRWWDYTVMVLHQCGHDLVQPIASDYTITEMPLQTVAKEQVA